MRTQLPIGAETAARLKQVFGLDTDPMSLLEERVSRLLPDRRVVLWEGDPATFQFSFVSAAAADVLGYPEPRWTSEPMFWADTVVHPDDRSDAVAFCAVATGQCRDHDFVYRAVAQDGRVVWLHDIVKVIRGPRGVPERLRGLMIELPGEPPAPEVEDRSPA